MKRRKFEPTLHNRLKREIEELTSLADRANARAEVVTRKIIKATIPPIPNIYNDDFERSIDRNLRLMSTFFNGAKPGKWTKALRSREEDRRRLYSEHKKIMKTAMKIIDEIRYDELLKFYFDCIKLGVVEACFKWERKKRVIKLRTRRIDNPSEKKAPA